MPDFLNLIFSTGNFEPHSIHFLPDNPGLMWFLFFSNIAIAFLYTLLPAELLYVYFKRRDYPFSWVFIGTAFFGVWCSATHIVMAIIFFYPIYYLQGVIDFIAGIVSLGVWVAFIPATILALRLTGPKKLKEETAKLEAEISKHKSAVEELVKRNSELDLAKNKVTAQNNELKNANKLMTGRELEMAKLKEEIDRLRQSSNTSEKN